MDFNSKMTDKDRDKMALRKRFEAFLENGSIKCVKMLEDRSIEVKYSFNFEESSTIGESIYKTDDPSWEIILSLIGEISPGELRYFARGNQTVEDEEIQKVLKPASVAFGIENGDVEKVTRTIDGGISLWMIYDRDKPSKEIKFSPDAPHIETILKYTGPLEPGETYVFDRLR